MKKALLILAALFVLGIEAFALNENVVVWQQIYEQVDTDDQRISVLLKIMDFKDREFTPVLVGALDKLVSRRLEEGPAGEVYDKNRLARLIVQELGNLKSIEAAESVFILYGEVKEPILKGEAAVALGKMRAVDYAEKLAFDLNSINLRPDPSKSRDQEIIALGLVQGLESMRSPLGYEPVFLASQGWYSKNSQVKDTAKAALVTMVDDPTDSIIDILVSNPSMDIKNAALAASLSSRASAERKAEVASRALQIGIDRATVDKASELAASTLRVAAITGLTGLRDKKAENVPLLVKSIGLDKKNDVSLDETVKAYVALGVNGSDDAAKFLSATLAEYNTREKSKLNTPRDKLLIRQVIASMVLTKNPLVKNVLLQAQFIKEYDGQIIREVQAALATFP